LRGLGLPGAKANGSAGTFLLPDQDADDHDPERQGQEGEQGGNGDDA